MDIKSEIDQIPELRNMGQALIDFVEDICTGITFEKKRRRWVGSPRNFVTFTIQYSRAKSNRISLRGYPRELPQFKELPLYPGRGYGAYTECTLTEPKQLAAIALCIQQAHELYNEGSIRPHKKLEIKPPLNLTIASNPMGHKTVFDSHALGRNERRQSSKHFLEP